jgi:hypothetical protein
MPRLSPRAAALCLGAALLSAAPVTDAEAQYYPYRRHNPGAASPAG